MDETPKYNEETCTTAEEFRRMGFKLPDNIPDYAWVPDWAIHYKYGPTSPNTFDDPDTLYMDLACSFDIPFRYIKIEFAIEI